MAGFRRTMITFIAIGMVGMRRRLRMRFGEGEIGMAVRRDLK